MAVLTVLRRRPATLTPRVRVSAPEPDTDFEIHDHARAVASMVAAGATVILFSLLMPPPDAISQDTLFGVSILLYAASALVALRARWERPALRRVALVLCVATGIAVGAAMSPRTGSGTAVLDRTEWLLGISLLVAAAVLIRALIVELNRKITLLAALARTDQLTTVANRRAWDEALEGALDTASRRGTELVVALLDLDRFKLYNDLRGHQEGDHFLHRTAHVWTQEVGDRGLLARFGGEEFAVLLPRMGIDEATLLVHRLREIVPEEQTCSAGIARWERGEAMVDLLRRADDALYDAKLAGRDRERVAARTSEDLPHRQSEQWSSTIRRLLSDRSLVSAYQPIIRFSDGLVVAYEALARPDRDRLDISVEQMFTVAQRRGVAREFDWLCRCAALEGASELPRELPLFINCNVSTLLDPVHRVDEMLAAVDAARRSPSEIVLEITERELIGDLDRLREVVAQHRRHGFRFAVDDVGEGHSTLEVLAAVAPEFIKIARPLTVDAMSRGPRAAIRAVVAFAQETGAMVIAEGIESDANARYLKRLGVDLAQGFFFGRPGLPTGAVELHAIS